MPNIKRKAGEDNMPNLTTANGSGDTVMSHTRPGMEEGKTHLPVLPGLTTLPVQPKKPESYGPYIFNGQVIDLRDDNPSDAEWKDTFTPHEQLRFVLKKLLACNVPGALSILAEHKTILRPLHLKSYYVKGEVIGLACSQGKQYIKFADGKFVASRLEWGKSCEQDKDNQKGEEDEDSKKDADSRNDADSKTNEPDESNEDDEDGKRIRYEGKKRSKHIYPALARYLFCVKENVEGKRCTECTNVERYGPFADCVVVTAGGGEDADEEEGSACLNCRYRGEAEYCSLRVGFGEVKKQAPYFLNRIPFPNFSQEDLRNVPTKALKKMEEVLCGALELMKKEQESQEELDAN
ncbi:hypothetical protein B0T20DRAFT_501687 [Sordaria brevicollis]|uniref:Uncharacterized protein n=1 Tax=Sordaria brevicollis TaxID=83679 RepID=A0AAE0U9W2_SORBR|nr:hypothetical protein B0T20DRAFT_501687 [Sordaria brevicollis]